MEESARHKTGLHFVSARVSDHPETYRYTFHSHDKALTWNEVLGGWQSGGPILNLFLQAIEKIPAKSYRWETPAVSTGRLTQPFQFVVTDDPWLDVPADGAAFDQWFSDADDGETVVVFPNLGGDAVMVVPLPDPGSDGYSHFGEFHRMAPGEKVVSFWKSVAITLTGQLTRDSCVWLNAAGGGVPWLHLRLDSAPKYYVHTPFRDPEYLGVDITEFQEI